MAELGVAASVIQLIEAGFALGKFLDDTYHDYRGAPAEVLEIASEVIICCELMRPLGEQLRAGAVRYTSRFETSVKALVDNSEDTFDSIRDLMPRNKDGTIDRGMIPRWTFVLNKRKIVKHRRRLVEIRQMFLFIKQAMNEASQQSMGAQSATTRDPPRPGVDDQLIVLTGLGKDTAGNTVHYSATLEMKPVVTVTASRSRASVSTPVSLQPPQGYLKRLRQNPYFSSELLKPRSVPQTRAYTPDPLVRDDTVEKMVAREKQEREKQIVAEVTEKKKRVSLEKASLEEPTDDFIIVPDDREAEDDIQDLIASWFGADEFKQRPSKPSLVVPDIPATTVGDMSGGRSSPRNKPWNANVLPKSPPPPVVERLSPSASRCDSCKDKIRGTRYECKRCANYDLCKPCFNSPEITLRLQHQHPKSQFTEIRQ